MATDYYRQANPEAAIVTVLNANLGTQFFAVTSEEAEYLAGQCVVEALPPSPRSMSMFGGHDHAVINITVTSVGANRANAKHAGSRVRQILTEREVNGAYTNPVVWATGKVDTVVSDTGYLETGKGVNTWVESFSVSYQGHSA